ncbi:MAG: tRNA (cytidine(34)-2'-O)-methyltransferase [Phycisphaerae bacterium]|nr:tRNA (cytidine(34)-2'-O)-methyltransferase [Phycisphaerae bacterium]
MPTPLFHVVMHEPEIPNNTGNIGRTCVATGCALHLIRPLGFDTSEKALRRAGLDYWSRLDVREHENWDRYLESTRPDGRGEGATPPRMWLTSGKRGLPLWQADLRPGDHLVFGKETAGLPESLLAAHPGRIITLPMVAGERGLNVSTVVCAVVYEGIRQCVARGEVALGSGDGSPRLLSAH